MHVAAPVPAVYEPIAQLIIVLEPKGQYIS